MRGMGATERLVVAAEDVRRLQRRPYRHGSGRWRHLKVQAVERAWRAAMVLFATCV
jgi:hypothetical protein